MNQAWVVTVDMGYGHQRAAYPLRHLSPTGKVIVANNYEGIPAKDYRLWNGGRSLYEILSRMSTLPLIGKYIFGVLDKFQEIKDFYPRRDLSAPNLQVKQTYYLIKQGMGRHLVQKLAAEKNIPFVTTFFSVAFAAEEFNYPNDIYLVVCDSDVSRTWAPMHPKKTRIKYLAPCRRVVERLQLYGIPRENIFLTGFPLPEENLGNLELDVLKEDLAERIINLDPEKRYRSKYAKTVQQFLNGINIEERHEHPLTLTFAVGGAGAQRKIADDILQSFKEKLLTKKININLVAGSRADVLAYFQELIQKNHLSALVDKNIRIIFNPDKESYFREFNKALRTTDILWTKPSELVFYSALGLPIIMAPSLGSQEDFNRIWLKTIGAGISQGDPHYAAEWLFDWINSGWLAEASMSGYLDERQFGVANMSDVIFKGVKEPGRNHNLL